VPIAVVYQRNAKRVVQLKGGQITFWRNAVAGPVFRNMAIIFGSFPIVCLRSHLLLNYKIGFGSHRNIIRDTIGIFPVLNLFYLSSYPFRSSNMNDVQ